MNFEAARAVAYARLDAVKTSTFSGYGLFYENQPGPDLATRTTPFITCEVVFNDGEQASIETTPLTRYHGAIWTSVWIKEGKGTAGSLTALGDLASLFKQVNFGGVKTKTPVPIPGRPKDGWYVMSLRTPFWFDAA